MLLEQSCRFPGTEKRKRRIWSADSYRSALGLLVSQVQDFRIELCLLPSLPFTEKNIYIRRLRPLCPAVLNRTSLPKAGGGSWEERDFRLLVSSPRSGVPMNALCLSRSSAVRLPVTEPMLVGNAAVASPLVCVPSVLGFAPLWSPVFPCVSPTTTRHLLVSLLVFSFSGGLPFHLVKYELPLFGIQAS